MEKFDLRQRVHSLQLGERSEDLSAFGGSRSAGLQGTSMAIIQDRLTQYISRGVLFWKIVEYMHGPFL
jgi:hypothetical protein